MKDGWKGKGSEKGRLTRKETKQGRMDVWEEKENEEGRMIRKQK